MLVPPCEVYDEEDSCIGITRGIFPSGTAIDRCGVQSPIKKYAQNIDTNPNVNSLEEKKKRRRHLNDAPANLKEIALIHPVYHRRPPRLWETP